jgi:DegV family protein with EDD domain
LPFDLLKNNNIGVIGMMTTFNGKEYIEDDWASVDMKAYYDSMRNGSRPTTSQITPDRFIHFFKTHLDEGRDLLYISFSSALSGTYDAACLARDTLLAEYPNHRIVVIDSRAASTGYGLLMLLTAAKIIEGHSLDEITAWVINNRLNIQHIFTVDDLNHLKRGGRVSAFSAGVGTLLSIKPILHVNYEGRLVNVEKVKGRKKALRTLASYFDKAASDTEKQDIYISHGDCQQDAETLRAMLMEKHKVQSITIVPIGMTIGAHTGPNALSLFFRGKSREPEPIPQ